MKKLFFCIDFCIKLTYNLIKSNCYLCSLRNYYLTDLWGSETVSFKLSLIFSKNYYLTDLWGSETICSCDTAFLYLELLPHRFVGFRNLIFGLLLSVLSELLPHRFVGFRNKNVSASYKEARTTTSQICGVQKLSTSFVILS